MSIFTSVMNYQHPIVEYRVNTVNVLITIMLIVIALGITGHFLIDAFCAPLALADASACMTSSLLGKGTVAICGLHCDLAQPTWFPADFVVTVSSLILLILLPSVSRSLAPLVPPPNLQITNR